MPRRGRTSNLRKSASKAYNKVARARGGMKCGTSRRGAKRRVCVSVAPVAGMKCGLNPINHLYACVARKRGRSARR